MNWLYVLGIVILAGIFLGLLVSYIKLPKVTGYLVAGIIIGPFVLKIVPTEAIHGLTVISEAALGFIAYSIGSSLNFKDLKKIGSGIIIIALFEALMAVVVVTLVMITVFKQPLAFSLSLGAIASATAPAATIMVLKQYRAKGPLVNTLIPVVAIDDAIAVIAFGIALSIAKALTNGTGALTVMSIMNPFIEIIGSAVLGIILGFVLAFINRLSNSREQTMSMAIGVILLAIGLANKLHLSGLLTCMVMGGTISNITDGKTKLLTVLDEFTNPIFIAFFTISGLELDMSVLKTVGIIGVGYVIARVIGKVLGAYLGAKIAKSEPIVQKYLGLTLVPQAGVAIGLALIVQNELPAYGTQIRTIILAGTVIYELIGPLCTKIAIFKAGEANKA
ncbi:cation:proton antiporter [Clostridium sulfidigenes]|uniref:cation:proton antiporter n=1 Tax=Clostridium sulfidigenes TaxID=318464 RepID=UPI003F8B6885